MPEYVCWHTKPEVDFCVRHRGQDLFGDFLRAVAGGQGRDLHGLHFPARACGRPDPLDRLGRNGPRGIAVRMDPDDEASFHA